MAAPTLTERWRLARMRAAAQARRARRSLRAPLRVARDLAARAPQRLLIAPPDIRTADPTIADDIYAGYFAFGSKIINTHGASPFAIVGPSPEWEAALMGFGWLRHMRAAGTPLACANARFLVGEWIGACGRPGAGVAWRPVVAARRLMSWLSQSPIILDEADPAFYRRFLRSLARHIVFLRDELRGGLRGEARLTAAIALASAALSLEASKGLARLATRLLASELDKQILVDGGHIGRNPQTLVDVLLDLLPLRQAYAARGLGSPRELVNAIDRIMPMLRMLQHPDGSLALFNGMGATWQDTLSTVLAYDDARAAPLANAPHAGYQRLEAGDMLVIADVGRPPPTDHSGRAHAGALSFELSVGGERLVVNCGAPMAQSGPLREAARATAAHSTLTVADTSSTRFAGADGADQLLDGRIIAGPRHVDFIREEAAGAVVVTASHDGYARSFGLVHTRRLTVAADGARLDGADSLSGVGKRAETPAPDYVLRFHLHPTVRVGAIDHGAGALLVTPGGQQWLFHAAGRHVSVEESAFFAAVEGVRATQQLVVAGQAGPDETVEWTFLRKDA